MPAPLAPPTRRVRASRSSSLVPKTAPEAKLRQIAVTGARLVTVDGPTSECCRLAELLARERGWVNLTTTFHNPYGVDAYATIAYEVAACQPDVLLLPISSGPLLAGMMKGFERLHRDGAIARIPRPIAVQPHRLRSDRARVRERRGHPAVAAPAHGRLGAQRHT